MKKSLAIFFFSACILFISCSKSQNEIDVSQQMLIDYSGNFVGGNGDGQWIAGDFSARELNLFSGLDTTDLSGSTKPASAITGSTIFPNPFTSVAAMVFNFPSGFSGQVVFKYVIVDDHLNIKIQGAVRLKATPDINNPSFAVQDFIHLSPDVPEGKYRLYFTLSAASDPNFYKSWGNIQKSDQ